MFDYSKHVIAFQSIHKREKEQNEGTRYKDSEKLGIIDTIEQSNLSRQISLEYE